MARPLLLVLVLLLGQYPADVSARREPLSEKQKALLAKAQTVLVVTLAITDAGPAAPGPLAEVVVRRMKELGYDVVVDPARPHNVVFKVKCEQRKTWEGTSASGGDADLPDSPSRVWKGPACQLTYLLDGRKMGWRKEVRTPFADAVEATAKAAAGDPGAYAMAKLKERLEDYDFPVLVTAEWAQDDRLLALLDDPATPPARKPRIMAALGDMFSAKAAPRLVTALRDPDASIAKAAVLALGNIGQKETIPAMIDLLKSGPPALRPSAAKALGILGALHGDFSIIQPLLEALQSDDVAVKTEAAWSLGKLPDRKAYEPLRKLQDSLYLSRHDLDPKMKKLAEAVNYSIKQIDTWEYIQ